MIITIKHCARNEVCVKVAELNPAFASIFRNCDTNHFEELTYSGEEKLLQYVVHMTEPGPEPRTRRRFFFISVSLLAADNGVIWKQRRIRLLRAHLSTL